MKLPPSQPEPFRDCSIEDHDFEDLPVIRVGEYYAAFRWRAGYDFPEAHVWSKHGETQIDIPLVGKEFEGMSLAKLRQLLDEIEKVARAQGWSP